MRPAVTLAPGEVHVWDLRTDELRDPALLARYERLLTPEELQKRDRYVFEKGRREYLFTRALVRTVLSAYQPQVPPEAWRFGANEHGRPFVAGPSVPEQLSFNLSNTSDRVICAVSHGCVVGADVECTIRNTDCLAIADRFFAPDELKALFALPRERQVPRFFELWTLKEAYIKAKGKGLAIPLDHFAFDLTQPQIQIGFVPELPDFPEQWRFFLTKLSPKHQFACAVQGTAAALRVDIRPAVPLTGLLAFPAR